MKLMELNTKSYRSQRSKHCVALIKMYPHLKIDNCRICISKEIDLNARSNQKSDERNKTLSKSWMPLHHSLLRTHLFNQNASCYAYHQHEINHLCLI